MILPIFSYGNSILREKAKEIDRDYPNLEALIQNMYNTSHNALGVGLAAPQVGLSIRLFVVDTTRIEDTSREEYMLLKDFKSEFINPRIISMQGEETVFNEGCLSFPNIFENISRKNEIEIEYYDKEFNYHKRTFQGFLSRVIQHEYDHLDGILFIDKVSSFKKKIIKSKLDKIQKGNVSVDYEMIFSKKV